MNDILKSLRVGMAYMLTLSLALSPLFSITASADVSLPDSINNIVIDSDGAADFGPDGDLYISGSRLRGLDYSTVFMYDVEEDEVIEDAPVFLGLLEAATSDGSGGFYVYGNFDYYQNRATGDNMDISEANISTPSIAHIDSTGYVDSVVSIDIDFGESTVNDILYVAAHDALFVAGDFEEIGEDDHNGIACVDPSTGDYCVIDAYDWSTNEGFFTPAAEQFSIAYDDENDVIILGGVAGVEYIETTDPEASITVLDPGDPTENTANSYLGIDDVPTLETRYSNATVKVIYVDTEEDLDSNLTTEKLLYPYTSNERIWAYFDNGAGFDSDTEISTLGIEGFELIAKEGTVNGIHNISFSFEDDPYELATSTFDFAHVGGGVFSIGWSIFNSVYEIIVPGDFVSEISGGTIDSDDDYYFLGEFRYEDDGNNELYNFIGIDNEGNTVFSGNPMDRADDTKLARSGDNILLYGRFQFADNDYNERSIFKIDPDTGEVDEDFDLRFVDEDYYVPDLGDFKIIGNYLYVYDTGEEFEQAYDISEESYTELPKRNIFRIDLTTFEVDETFEPEIAGDPNIVEMTAQGDLIILADEDGDFHSFEEDGSSNDEWDTNFADAAITITDTDNLITGDDGHVYAAVFDTDGNMGRLLRIDTEGNVTVSYAHPDFITQGFLQYDDYLVTFMFVDADFYMFLFEFDDEGTATFSTDLAFSGYLFDHSTEWPAVRSIVKDDDNIYVSGRFESITTDAGEGVTYERANFISFDLEDGYMDSPNIFDSMYSDSSTTTLRIAHDSTNSNMALFGDFSFQLTDTTESFIDSPFGLVLLDSNVGSSASVSSNNGGGGGRSSGRTISTSSGNTDTAEEDDLTYEEEIEQAKELELVTEGFTDEANKCEVLVMMSRLFDWDIDTSDSSSFTDIPDWCHPYAAFAENNGIASGRSEGLLGMDSSVTRYEVAVMIYNELVRAGYEFTGSESVEFIDNIEEWARGAVEALVREGIIKGFADGSFGGSSSIIKQDLGVMLVRIEL